MIGQTLGHYRIVEQIGAGDMGEVYKATDTCLDCTVAVKVLPAHAAADPDRGQRFEREARTIFSLNHPHICTFHDIGNQDEVLIRASTMDIPAQMSRPVGQVRRAKS